jgi:hypothetical protein
VRIILGLFGISLVLLVAYDVLWTTLRLEGAGPLTSWVTTVLWRLSLKLTRTHRTLAIAGFDIVLFTVVLWLGFIWIGWALVLGISPHALMNVTTGQPAGFWERLYVVGANLVTFGTAEYQPQGATWHMVATLAAANGFFLFSLVITYLLPLVQAVQQRREIAVYISSLGVTPDEILLKAWNGTGFGLLPDHLVALTPRVMNLSQGHLNYPVLHCFHSQKRESAVAPMMAVLDEALTLLEGVDPEVCPDRVAVYPLRGAIQQLLSTLAEAHLEPEKVPPPAPSLDGLRQAGLPTRSDDELQRRVDGLADRRKLLMGLVEQEGWHWRDVFDAG